MAGSAKTPVFEVALSDLEHAERRIEDCFDLRLDLEGRDQFAPIIVVQEGGVCRVVDGAKRVVAAKDLGWSHLFAIFAAEEDSLGSTEIAVAEAITNTHRKPFCWSRVARKSLVMEERLRADGSISGRVRKYVAARLHVNDRTLAKARTLVNLVDDPDVHEITRSVALAACERMDRERLVDGAYKSVVPYAALEDARPRSDRLLDRVACGELSVEDAVELLPEL